MSFFLPTSPMQGGEKKEVFKENHSTPKNLNNPLKHNRTISRTRKNHSGQPPPCLALWSFITVSTNPYARDAGSRLNVSKRLTILMAFPIYKYSAFSTISDASDTDHISFLLWGVKRRKRQKKREEHNRELQPRDL